MAAHLVRELELSQVPSGEQKEQNEENEDLNDQLEIQIQAPLGEQKEQNEENEDRNDQSPIKKFKVFVETIARNVDPKKNEWPLSLDITNKDTPEIIAAKFKKKYGYSIDSTLMLEPQSWKKNKEGEVVVHEHGCFWRLCRGSRREQFIMDNKQKSIEVWMQSRGTI